jgi:hypothetical protein
MRSRLQADDLVLRLEGYRISYLLGHVLWPGTLPP